MYTNDNLMLLQNLINLLCSPSFLVFRTSLFFEKKNQTKEMAFENVIKKFTLAARINSICPYKNWRLIMLIVMTLIKIYKDSWRERERENESQDQEIIWEEVAREFAVKFKNICFVSFR